MGHRYQHLVFGPESVVRQQAVASYEAYGAGLKTPDEGPQELTTREMAMLTGAFQVHLATVSPTGWPYLQYRSGPRGFIHHLGGNRIGFADFAGNRQFVTTGNIDADPRVALFVADFPRRRRLKLFGRATVTSAADDPTLLTELMTIGSATIGTRGERSVVIDVEAFDWNCSRSLIPQYTDSQVRERTQPYIDRITELQERNAELQAALERRDRSQD